MFSLLPLLSLIVPSFIAFLCLFTSPFSFLESFYRKIEKESLLVGTSSTFFIVLSMLPDLLAGNILETPILFLRFDMKNAAGVTGVALIFFLTSIYNIKSEKGGRLKPSLYNFFVMLFLVCLLGLLLSYDMFLIFLFVELGIGVSITLVAHAPNKISAESAFKYLIITAISALFVLFGLLTVYVLTGNSNIMTLANDKGPLIENPRLLIFVVACFVIGLGADIGLVPFHGWVPDVFPASTPAVNGFFCAEPVAFILALYKLVYPFYAIYPSEIILWFMVGVGLVSLLFGVLMAFPQTDYMRMMAYTSIEEFGHMVLVLGLFTPLSFVAGELYLVNGALMKTGMILSLGSVYLTSGTNNMNSLGGLAKKMKKVALIYLICALSLAGVPPFSGFYSKWLLINAVYEFMLPHGVLASVSALVLLVSVSMVFVTYLVRSFHWIFLGRINEKLVDVNDVPWAMWLPTAMLAGAAILVGLQPNLLLSLIGAP